MSKVIARLEACALEYQRRHDAPRVAWDVMAAKTWANRCALWAVEFRGREDREIIEALRGLRTAQVDHAGGVGFLVSMDLTVHIDRILDPVDQDRPRGYIEIARPGSIRDGEDRWTPDPRPVYRRMLGTNRQVDGIMRGPLKPHTVFDRLPEADDAWLERRRAWLAQYHPDTWVVRTQLFNPDGEAYELEGRVGDFIETPHLAEPLRHRFKEAA